MADQSVVGRVTADASRFIPPWKGTARFEVLGCLGRGGMGIVYEVFDWQEHARVALKTVLHFDPVSLYRFKQEFRTLADVLHPNLVHLHELVAGEDDDVFFTMELIEGSDFIEHVQMPGRSKGDSAARTTVVTIETARRRAQKAAGQEVLAVESDAVPRARAAADFDKLRPALRQLVEGVRALHAAGKLHRDLKPSNVRVTPEGRVVILDFGVATELKRRSETDGGEEEFVGTVTYMAPEQASGEGPVAASDWYSVGALLYEAIVGSPPYGGSAIDILTLKSTVIAMSPSECVDGVPEDLDALCVALLSIDPEDRPDSTEILRQLGAKANSDHAPPMATVDGFESQLLVGRDAETRSLGEAFAAVGEGRSVAVRVSGLSGLGKSSLVHHYLNELNPPGSRGEVLVLRGRAYERESMPYKAIDSVVDALSWHLMEHPGLPLPDAMGALAHLFPVLRRAPAVDAVPKTTGGDPQVVRQLAFGALRELLTTLSTRQRVVVFIDDVQWGDNDSAALLVEVMRPPAPPPILLLTTHRSEDAATSPFLSDVRMRWPEDAEVREITVGPLELDDARRLAGMLLGASPNTGLEIADGIARESGGAPSSSRSSRAARAPTTASRRATPSRRGPRSRSTTSWRDGRPACRTMRDGCSRSSPWPGGPCPCRRSARPRTPATRPRSWSPCCAAGASCAPAFARGARWSSRSTLACARRSWPICRPTPRARTTRSSRRCSRRPPTPIPRPSPRTWPAQGTPRALPTMPRGPPSKRSPSSPSPRRRASISGPSTRRPSGPPTCCASPAALPRRASGPVTRTRPRERTSSPPNGRRRSSAWTSSAQRRRSSSPRVASKRAASSGGAS